MPDHPSWPAELVEKAARALAQANTSIAWDVMPNRMRADFRHEAQAVLSALSGDLVPREKHERHDAWLGCISGGWAGYQAMCSCGWRGPVHDSSRDGKRAARGNLADHEAKAAPAIELVPRSQADALAEALDYLITRCEREFRDCDQPPEMDFVMLAVQEVKPRLASYRSKPAPGETK